MEQEGGAVADGTEMVGAETGLGAAEMGQEGVAKAEAALLETASIVKAVGWTSAVGWKASLIQGAPCSPRKQRDGA
ncbi:hypothetical protein AB1Y20_017979 [Prymnesium parvum]|uniref:Uncharacterized protein n=1 Tax=Prymnesium parvum TaxID=97485 RepID=A0AB34JP10_PRYPA